MAMSPYEGLAAPPAVSVREPWLERGDVRAALALAGALVVLGVVAGFLWAAISPHGSGVVVTKTEIVPFEQENWIAADGRFAIITAAIGLVAGLVAWFWKSRRGPVLAAGLALGSILGSALTALIGRAVSSGHSTGAINSGIRLHVVLHAHGLVALEGVLALAAYLGGVLFAGPDDLGRPADTSPTYGSTTDGSTTDWAAANPPFTNASFTNSPADAQPGFTGLNPGYSG